MQILIVIGRSSKIDNLSFFKNGILFKEPNLLNLDEDRVLKSF